MAETNLLDPSLTNTIPPLPATSSAPSVANSVVPAPTSTVVVPPPAPITPVAGYTPVSGAAGASTAIGYDPTPYVVPEKGLVQQQITDIIGNDSPLMQQARTRAAQMMNARGLLNSTLNTQAAQEAVIAQALPIAQADAASMREAAFKTAEARNTASQFGAAAENTASSTNAQLITSMNTTNANAANNALATNAQAENVRNLALIDNNTKQMLAVLDAQNRQFLQSNANAANMFQEVVKNIAAIAVDPSLTPAAKNQATQTQINLLQEGLRTTAAISGLNLEQFFNTTAGGEFAGEKAALPSPIAGTNPLKSQWSDGQLHKPPKPGFAVEVPGYGWWGSDGKFYATQAEAINRKGNVTPAPAPAQ